MRCRWASALLVLAILLSSLPVGATTPPDQLIPIDEDYTLLESLAPYHRALRERLLVSDRPSGAYVLVVPSFRNEWAIQVSNSGGYPVVTLVLAVDSLWGLIGSRAQSDRPFGVGEEAAALPTIGLRVSVKRAVLSGQAGRLVRDAWNARLQAGAVPSESRRSLDGTLWFFSAQDAGGTRRSGIGRSPREGTPAAALTDLVLALREHAEADSADRARTEAAVLRRAEAALR